MNLESAKEAIDPMTSAGPGLFYGDTNRERTTKTVPDLTLDGLTDFQIGKRHPDQFRFRRVVDGFRKTSALNQARGNFRKDFRDFSDVVQSGASCWIYL